MGRLFPAMFGKVVYAYTAKALPDMDIRAFRKKQMKEYKAMAARTPSVGSAKENMERVRASASVRRSQVWQLSGC